MRENFISYKLSRAGVIDRRDYALLNYINSYSNYCADKLDLIAERLKCSKRTIQYMIERLVSLGLIKRRYGIFKRLILSIVSVKEQESLFGFSTKFAVKVCENIKQKYYVQKAARIDVQGSAHSIKSSTKEIKISNFPYFENSKEDHPGISNENDQLVSEFLKGLR